MLVESLAGAAAAAGTLAYAVRAPQCSLLAPSAFRGARDRRSIALTFDDGPSESTPALLEILDRYRVPATFFQCGANARRLPGIVREVLAAGHEIGNHTDSHPMLHFHSPAFIYRELEAAQVSIAEASGFRPRLFRAPFGVRWFGLRGAQERLGLQGVMWSVLGLDWKWPAERVAARLTARAANGSIICLHDGRQTTPHPDISVTVEAVRRVIPQWIEQGFQFETVSQILCPTN